MGFRRLSDIAQKWHMECRHPEHNPPGMIVLEPGNYEWTCPGCGGKQRVEVPERPHCSALRDDSNPMHAFGHGRGDS